MFQGLHKATITSLKIIPLNPSSKTSFNKKKRKKKKIFWSFRLTPMWSIDNGIDVPMAEEGERHGPLAFKIFPPFSYYINNFTNVTHPPSTSQKKKKNSGSVPVTLTEIFGPQVWTGSYKFSINKVKNLQGLWSSRRISIFRVGPAHSWGIITWLQFWIHHLLPWILGTCMVMVVNKSKAPINAWILCILWPRV